MLPDAIDDEVQAKIRLNVNSALLDEPPGVLVRPLGKNRYEIQR